MARRKSTAKSAAKTTAAKTTAKTTTAAKATAAKTTATDTKAAEVKATETKTAEVKPAEVKVAEKKVVEAPKTAEVKEPAKKTEAKAAEKKVAEAPKTETKAPARKTCKTDIVLEIEDLKVSADAVQKAVKASVKEKGLTGETLDIYVNMAEKTAYYTVDGVGGDDYSVDLRAL